MVGGHKGNPLSSNQVMNTAKISLFLNSLYLVAIFSASAQNLQKQAVVRPLELPFPQNVATQHF